MASTSALPIGTLPPVGEVPPKMLAQVVRQERLGAPIDAFQIEEIDTPSIKVDEVLVAVMAAGINYNNVWAAQGIPIEIIATRQRAGSTEDFHVGGSDASGIVYAVGDEVTNVEVGDEVVDPPRLVGERRPLGDGWQGPDDRGEREDLGLRGRTTAPSGSSPWRRPTSACRRPNI